jgi:hypothetical protein
MALEKLSSMCHGSDRDDAFALLFCFRHVLAYTRLLSSKRDEPLFVLSVHTLFSFSLYLSILVLSYLTSNRILV